MPGGEERPAAFASRTLSASEKNYAQLEKEALSIIYGVKKCHQYLFVRKFTLETDHKPLLTILGPKSAVPTLAAARLQRWALILASYHYEVVFRKTPEHSNADGLSRLPADKAATPEENDIFHFTNVNDLPVTARDISDATKKDPVLSKVLQLVKCGCLAKYKRKPWTPILNGALNFLCNRTVFSGGCESLFPGHFRTGSLKTFMLINQEFAV